MAKSGKFDNRWLGVSIPAEHWHFHRRLYERYNIILAPGEYSGIMKDIRKGVAVLLHQEGHRRVYLVNQRSTGTDICVAVSGARLATALLPSFVTKKKKKKAAHKSQGILEFNGVQIRVFFRKTSGEAD
jgi:hypothetical protein